MASHSLRDLSLTLILLALFSISLSMLSGSASAEEDSAATRVYGRVVDAETGRPIAGTAIILFKRFEFRLGYTYDYCGWTNKSGHYEIMVKAKDRGDYRVYAISDDPSTPGFDYLPVAQLISVAENPLNVSFNLMPAASIYMEGRFGPFKSGTFPYHFRVVDQYGLLNETGTADGRLLLFRLSEIDWTLCRMGFFTTSPQVKRTVIVPADTPVMIEMEITKSERFTFPSGGRYITLTQGSLFAINLHVLWVANNPNYVSGLLQSVQALVGDAEEVGFYVFYERDRLFKAEVLVEAAQSALSKGDYENAYAYLHEAYYIIENLREELPRMSLEASHSVFFITPFLGFTAVALASTLFENLRKKLTVSLSLYVLLFGLLYLLYPGYKTLERGSHNPLARTPFADFFIPIFVGASFLLPLFAILVLPMTFKERTSMERLRLVSAVAAAFSVASRNLRRRKLRTILTSAFMLISVFTFITLTSVSFEYGFTVQPWPGQALYDGLLIRKRGKIPIPLEQYLLQWLKGRTEVVKLAPKMENQPVGRFDEPLSPLTTIYAPNSGLSFNISGVLGVYPSLEAETIRMHTIVVEGRFLEDGDLRGILISREAAQELKVKLHDILVLYGQEFNVTGIFDSGRVERLRDIDGESILPKRIKILHPPELSPFLKPLYWVEPVPGSEVVVVHVETAKILPKMILSKIMVQTRNPGDTMSLGRLTVLLWPGVEAFTSVAGKISHLLIGEYHTVLGFAELMVPLALMALNIGVMMLSAVYERKREIATMSCLGLNPSHIAAVFIAEALVIGVATGSLGYLLGLVSYRFMVVFPTHLVVKQKVEAFWGVLALCFSIEAAVLGTVKPALKSSLIATPSLVKRWKIKIEERPWTVEEPWRLRMPIRLHENEVERFFAFMERRLREYAAPPHSLISDIKVFRDAGGGIRLSFTYYNTVESIVVTDNVLSAVRRPRSNRYYLGPEIYRVYLASRTRRGTIKPIDEADVRQTASFIRDLILQYDVLSAPKGDVRRVFRRGWVPQAFNERHKWSRLGL